MLTNKTNVNITKIIVKIQNIAKKTLLATKLFKNRALLSTQLFFILNIPLNFEKCILVVNS